MKKYILLFIVVLTVLIIAKAPASLLSLGCNQVPGVSCFSPKPKGTLWQGELGALEVSVNGQTISAKRVAWDLDVLSIFTLSPSASLQADTSFGRVNSKVHYDDQLLKLKDANARLAYSFDGFSTQLDANVAQLDLAPDLGVISWQGSFSAQNSTMRLGQEVYVIGELQGELIMRDAKPTVTLASSGGNVGIEGSCELSNWRYDCDIILDARDIDTRSIDRVIGLLGQKIAPGIYQLQLGGKLQ